MISDDKSKDFVQSTVFIFLVFFPLLVASLIFKPWELFYENRIYVYYFRSWLEDGDFNIVNQITRPMAWIATRNYFYPDTHPESQTAFMLPIYFFEAVARRLVGAARDTQFQLALTTITMNILSLVVGYRNMHAALSELRVRLSKIDFLLFYVACPLFFFSFLQTTVLEVLAFPLLSFLFLVFVQFRVRHEFSVSPFVLGAVCGFLMITKLTFWPLCLLVGGHYILNCYRREGARQGLNFLIALGLILLGHWVNQYLEFGYLAKQTPPINRFFDYSLDTIRLNLVDGLFGKGGLFFVNPGFLVGLVGLGFALSAALKRRVFNGWDVAFLSLTVLALFGHHAFILGYKVEDHLPGRIHLALLPLLIFGFAYLKNVTFSRWPRAALLTMVAIGSWHLFVTVNYILIAQIESYRYAESPFLPYEWVRAAIDQVGLTFSQNLETIQEHGRQIFVFAGFVSAVLAAAIKLRTQKQLALASAVLMVVAFLAMTLSNVKNHEGNISHLKSQGFYNEMAIGDGDEIFSIDYILEYIRYVRGHSSDETNRAIESRLAGYYGHVKGQILRSTPELDAAIATHSQEFSYLIKMESEQKARVLAPQTDPRRFTNSRGSE